MKEPLKQLHLEGTLCEMGLLKEEYNEKKQDLVRKFTKKGLLEVKDILLDPAWSRTVKAVMKENNWTDEDISNFLAGLK